MDQWVTLERNAPPTAVAVTSLTVENDVALAVTATAHQLESNDEVEIEGAGEADFNGRFVVTVLTPTTFTFAVAPGAPAAATGTITVSYRGDAQGGRREFWTSLGQIAAEITALSGAERLQAQQVASRVQYSVRLWGRVDVTPADRLQWDGITLQIEAVLKIPGRLGFLELDCVESL
jgi:SPP1 family predicted phage head-tail adaptor